MIEAWGELNVRETFEEAARTFVNLVQRIPQGRWDGPGLGEWNLRALVGHTSRSLVTVETYLGQPVETEEVPGPAAYYVGIAGIDHAGVVGRGVAAGQALGENPAQFVADLAERVLAHTHVYKERGNEAYALRLLGEITAQRQPPDAEAAAAAYHQAMTLADELGMRPLAAHCHLSLGTLYARTVRLEQARAELSAAMARYRAMDMTFWLSRVEAVLVPADGC